MIEPGRIPFPGPGKVGEDLNINLYSNYLTFLDNKFNAIKLRNPNFSLGAWASKIGLGNAASISRILNGDRIPGEETVKKLVNYFEFSADEEKHFLNLIERQRKFQMMAVSDPSFQIRNGRDVVLFSQVNLQAAKNWLPHTDLVPVERDGHGIMSLNIIDYPNTSVGPYRQFFICLLVQPKSGGVLNQGFFISEFRLDPEFTSLHELMAGPVNQQWPLQKINIGREKNSLQVNVGESLRFDLKDRGGRYFEDEYKIQGFYFNGESYQTNRFSFITSGHEYPYDDERDNISLDGELGDLCHQLGLQPIKWLIHENLNCLSSDPVPFKLNEISSF